AVEAFEYEQDSGLPELDGARGLTVRFVHLTAPGQSVLAGTTMYRLAVLARLLGDSGADAFFGDSAEPAPLPGERRRLADAVMEAALGTFVPPRFAFLGYGRYLVAAFAEPRNRARAD